MGSLGLRGMIHGIGVHTTIGDVKAACPLDRLNRQFRRIGQTNCGSATSPTSRLGRAGCTWPSTSTSYPGESRAAGRAVRCARTLFSMRWSKPYMPGNQSAIAAWSVTRTEGLNTSAFATANGRQRLASSLQWAAKNSYKAELIHRRAPSKATEAVEFATLEWVAWFNHNRFLEPKGYSSLADAEANYYRQLASQTATVEG